MNCGLRHFQTAGSASTNDWLRAFEWIRHNTPPNAVFAIEPNYMLKDASMVFGQSRNAAG